MKKISSVQNQEIKDIVKLFTPKGRKEQQRFIAQGWRIISTLLHYGMQPLQLYSTESGFELNKEQILSHDIQDNIILVTDQVIKKISPTTTASGIVGIFAIPQQPSWDKLGTGIILYELSDPGNMGTLIRTCAAMNAKTVVCINGVDPWNPKVVQASAGTIAGISLFQASWDELYKNRNNLKLCSLIVSEGKKPEKIDFSDTLLIIGSEAHGLPPLVIEQSDELLTLPMPGGTESLNAAVAGSIAIYLAWHSIRS